MNAGKQSGTAVATQTDPRRSPAMHLSCIPCRRAKQKCSRQKPCVRCVSNDLECLFPEKSYRGRKLGSKNKKESAEHRPGRTKESALSDEAIVSLLGDSSTSLLSSSLGDIGSTTEHNGATMPLDSGLEHGQDITTWTPQSIAIPGTTELSGHAEVASEVTSSLQPHVLSGVTKRFLIPHAQGRYESSFSSAVNLRSNARDQRLITYFGPVNVQASDWNVLAAQSSDDLIQLRPSVHDPLLAEIIDSKDASRYFDLFFTSRNRLIGALDPILHTFDFVYSRSFTLFSVICTLGCAVSNRQSDRVKYPMLLALADSNIRWSIAYAVKTVETIQAIINMAYWAPLSERLDDDPTWLRISHASQIAREIGLDLSLGGHDVSLSGTISAAQDERMKRNLQRTWLYVFMIDKSFAMTTGRPISVHWRDIDVDVSSWWRHPIACPADQIISACMDMRMTLLRALDRRKEYGADLHAIELWQSESVDQLYALRHARCQQPDGRKTEEMCILAFCLDHAFLILNAQAIQEIGSLKTASVEASMAVKNISQQNVDVGIRLMDHVLVEDVFKRLKLGIHNTQILMICHAAIEIIQAIDRGLPLERVNEARSRLRLMDEHLSDVASGLPASSWVSVYGKLFKVLVGQVEQAQYTDAPVDMENIVDISWEEFLEDIQLVDKIL